jgi:pyridoxal phosphate enzyme (YggS family)
MQGSEGDIARNVNDVLDSINEAALMAGRDPETITLMAVTKRVVPSRIKEAYDAGVRSFGENYIQEALEKIELLPPDAHWSMIGNLQSNKAKRVIDSFDMLQTMDRQSLSDALQKAAVQRGVFLPVLLQVNVGGERSKAGGDFEAVMELAKASHQWPNLQIRGLMAIPPYTDNPADARAYFKEVFELAEKISSLGLPGVSMDQLSMGMSHDYKEAILEGATIVRVGSAIFGARH